MTPCDGSGLHNRGETARLEATPVARANALDAKFVGEVVERLDR